MTNPTPEEELDALEAHAADVNATATEQAMRPKFSYEAAAAQLDSIVHAIRVQIDRDTKQIDRLKEAKAERGKRIVRLEEQLRQRDAKIADLAGKLKGVQKEAERQVARVNAILAKAESKVREMEDRLAKIEGGAEC